MRLNYKTKQLLSEETMTEQEIAFAIQETSLNLQQDILATKRELESAKMRLEVTKSTYPLDVDAYIEAKQDVEACTSGLNDLLELEKELGFSK